MRRTGRGRRREEGEDAMDEPTIREASLGESAYEGEHGEKTRGPRAREGDDADE